MFTGLSVSELGIVIVSILISVGLHEALHAWTAHKLGDPTAHELGRVTLNPLAHIDILTTVALPVVLILLGLPPFFIAKPVPFRPDLVKYGEFGAALVGIAGPLTNFVLAALGASLYHFGIITPGTEMFTMVLLFIQVNVALFVFNMIPFPPLDGSRVLYAFAPDFLRKIMAQIEAFGFIAIVFFMLLLYQFIAPFVTGIMDAVLRFLL